MREKKLEVVVIFVSVTEHLRLSIHPPNKSSIPSFFEGICSRTMCKVLLNETTTTTTTKDGKIFLHTPKNAALGHSKNVFLSLPVRLGNLFPSMPFNVI